MTEADFNEMMKDPYGAPFLDYHGEDYAALIRTLQGERNSLSERLQEMLEYSVKLQRLVECAARALRGEKFVLPEDSKGLHHYDMLKEIFDKGAA